LAEAVARGSFHQSCLIVHNRAILGRSHFPAQSMSIRSMNQKKPLIINHLRISPFPIPYSLFPIPHFPIPHSLFTIPHSPFPLPY
jgi:hypothetical protein